MNWNETPLPGSTRELREYDGVFREGLLVEDVQEAILIFLEKHGFTLDSRKLPVIKYMDNECYPTFITSLFIHLAHPFCTLQFIDSSWRFFGTGPHHQPAVIKIFFYMFEIKNNYVIELRNLSDLQTALTKAFIEDAPIRQRYNNRREAEDALMQCIPVDKVEDLIHTTYVNVLSSQSLRDGTSLKDNLDGMSIRNIFNNFMKTYFENISFSKVQEAMMNDGGSRQKRRIS